MRGALANHPRDLVIADYALPEFNALAALAIPKESGLDLPFIIVSRTIREETAATASGNEHTLYAIVGQWAS